MNKSNNNELSAQTEADSNSTDQNKHVSQPNANTNVVGSLFEQRKIMFRAWDNVHKCFDETVAANILMQLHEPSEDVDNGYNKRFFLSQYTGLKDMNYKDIYEGDFVEISDPYNGQFAKGVANIIFSQGYVGGWVAQHDGNVLNIGTRTKYIRVVGNIFENPDLLETLH
jgi:uncharacterized phage protein (TIGR01671 family)